MEDINPYLLSVKPMIQGMEGYGKINIDQDQVSIGRGLENSIIIPDSQILATNCTIKKNLNEWFIKTTNARAILLNNIHMVKHRNYLLKENDLVQFDSLGDFVYKFIASRPRSTMSIENTLINKHFENKLPNKKEDLIEILRGPQELIEIQNSSLEANCNKKICELTADINYKVVELIETVEIHNSLKNKVVADKEQITSELYPGSSRQTLSKQLTININTQEEIKIIVNDEFEKKFNYQIDYIAVSNDNGDSNQTETIQSLRLEQLSAPCEAAGKEMTEVTDHECTHKDNLKVIGGILESELRCSICSELYIKPTTLNCSHTFCEFCINKWIIQVNKCPICRAVIKSKCSCLSFAVFIDRMVENLSEEIKMKREQVLRNRQIEVESTEQAMDFTEDADEVDEQNTVRIFFPSSEIVPGLPGAQYSGQSRCHICGYIGHWRLGCPF